MILDLNERECEILSGALSLMTSMTLWAGENLLIEPCLIGLPDHSELEDLSGKITDPFYS